PVFQSGAEPCRFSKRAHIRREPEMAFRLAGIDRDRLPSGLHAFFVEATLLGFGRVSAEPVIGARQLPGAGEVAWILGERRAPQIRRAPGAGQILAVCIESVRGLGEDWQPGERYRADIQY